MERFLYEKLAERSPHLSPAGLTEEKAIIDYNVRRHGTKTLQRMLTGVLYPELKEYRIYSDGAEASPLRSLPTGCLDNLLDLTRGQDIGPFAFGFLADDS